MTTVGSFSLAVAWLMLFSATLSADVTVGLPADVSGNCIPFGCPSSFFLMTYQQDYASTDFAGPLTIIGIEFFNTVFVNGAAPAAGTYDFSLAYTSKPVHRLDLTNPSNNITAGSQAFFRGSLPSLAGGKLEFTGTPFSYDPALGNLLLTVAISGGFDGSPDLFLDEAQTQLTTSRAFFGTIRGPLWISGGRGNDLGGLVTEFVTSTSTVPEPGGTVFLLVTVLSILLFCLHKCKRFTITR